jgi:hypothetical protein
VGNSKWVRPGELVWWDEEPGRWLASQRDVVGGWFAEATRDQLGEYVWRVYGDDLVTAVSGVADTPGGAQAAAAEAVRASPRGQLAPTFER